MRSSQWKWPLFWMKEFIFLSNYFVREYCWWGCVTISFKSKKNLSVQMQTLKQKSNQYYDPTKKKKKEVYLWKAVLSLAYKTRILLHCYWHQNLWKIQHFEIQIDLEQWNRDHLSYQINDNFIPLLWSFILWNHIS